MHTVLVALAVAYVAAGLVTAALVLGGLAGRFDAAARGASAGFHLVVLPGVVLLWPLVLRAALRRDGAEDRTAHDAAAREGATREGATREEAGA